MKYFNTHEDGTKLSDSAMVRMAALMGDHERLRWPGDRADGRKTPVRPRNRALSRSEATHASKRQDALLDEALSQTFPASDPVSIAYVS